MLSEIGKYKNDLEDRFKWISWLPILLKFKIKLKKIETY